jgi:nucleoside-diphosphate-sugar epimerase
MKNKKPSILITGVNGFVGKHVYTKLLQEDYEVWSVYNNSSSNQKNSFKIDLTKKSQLFKLKEKLPKKFIIIHSAAVAHEKNDAKSTFLKNVKMTENIIDVLSEKIIKFIFLSSVSVYGEDGNNRSIGIHQVLRPYSEYGRSKRECEKLIMNSKIEKYLICRLAPVFDNLNLTDIKKRVMFPGIGKFRLIIKPNPEHSLLEVNNFCDIILKAIFEPSNSSKIRNVHDLKPYSQNELSKWFDGPKLILPEFIFSPIYWITFILPQNKGHRLRCFYWKFFKSNVYE